MQQKVEASNTASLSENNFDNNLKSEKILDKTTKEEEDVHAYYKKNDMMARGGSSFWFKECSMEWLHAYYWIYWAGAMLTVFHHWAWFFPTGLLVPRIVQHIHYVHHMRSKGRNPILVDLAFLGEGPISLSYKEIGLVHDSHHKYSCHPTKDLQYNLIVSGKYLGVEAWLRNFFQPELEFYCYAVENKLHVNWWLFAVRVVLFGVLVAFMPASFWYLICFPVRFQRMQFYFFAFHFQHRDGPKYLPDGKNFVLAPWLRPLVSFLNGHENVLAMEYHIIHHDLPYIPVEDHPKPLDKLCRTADGTLKDVCDHHCDWHFPSYKRVYDIPGHPYTDKDCNPWIEEAFAEPCSAESVGDVSAPSSPSDPVVESN